MGFSLNRSPTAIQLNSQIVVVHPDPEKSTLAPISSPTISGNPIFNSILLSPTNNCDFVVAQWGELDLLEYTSGVCLELLSGVNTARDRAASVDFGFHLVSSCDQAVLFNFPYAILWLSPTVSFVSRFGSCRWRTIHTLLNIGAREVFRIFSSIGLATLFRNTVIFSININLTWISPITRTTSPAIDNNLGRQVHIWPGPIPDDIDSIGNGRGSAMCPT